jgi:hypothetical protein
MPGFPFPEFIQPDPYLPGISYIMSKGNSQTRTGPLEQEKKTKNPWKEQFCSWQKGEIPSPDSPGIHATLSIFSS